jgi:5-methylthioribose kinase
MYKEYEPLNLDNLPNRLSEINEIADRVGSDPKTWIVNEVGDGNLNLVFIIKGPVGTIIVKQALPYVRLVGDSWPLTLDRAFFEYNALLRQDQRDPGIAPEVYYFDKEQGLIAMEYLAEHKILRQKLIAGEKVRGLASTIGKHCAKLAFKGSDLHMLTQDKKNDVALFQKNNELMAITENLVFTDPYFEAEMNQNTKGLEGIIKLLRDDVELKSKVQHMLKKFTSNAETMCHGDLHSGSIMCTSDKTRVIDPEFAFYGPMGFDLGMLIANYLMAFFSQPAHRSSSSDTETYQEWILNIIKNTTKSFVDEFILLWKTERKGILYPESVFENQGHSSLSAMNDLLQEIWVDAVTVCGIEMHRRCLSLAHNADFEEINDLALKAKLEARNLIMGRELILKAHSLNGVEYILEMARDFNRKELI